MQPLTIAALVHAYLPEHRAGSEVMLHSLLRALVERGHHCEVYIASYAHTKSRRPTVIDGVHVYPPMCGHGFPGGASQADVLVTHHGYTRDGINFALRHRKPLVQVLHNTAPDTAMWASCKAELLVYNSQWMAAKLGNDPRGIIVRPPVNPADYRTTPGHAVTLVNLNADKGGELFWELAARMPEAEFTGVRGSYGRQITGEAGNVNVLPHGVRMRDVYAATRVLLMPSRHESWGMVGVEGMASGIPTIAHPTPGLRESLGDAGIFCDRDDPDAWETEIRRLLDEPEAWQAASKKALARSVELAPTEDLAAWCEAVEGLV